uniref:Axonemal dynein light chain domain containing 1 n=1 Tax=Leptobrachium leishanense TaxID=445787 RepID=A0A8C5R128_9ANUR
MSLAEFPSPPAVPKPLGRRVMGSPSLVPLGGDIPEASTVQDNGHALEKSPHLQCDYIPDEIVQVLTSTAHPTERPIQADIKKTKDAKVFMRPIDSVWSHPLRRSKFKHLIDQPVCLTGAGRDISFLCDALHMQKISKESQSVQPSARRETTPRPMGVSIEESLIPEEFYIVKNKGVLGLEYYEDKYTTLLEDDEKRLRVFPSMKPTGRSEVLQLMMVMDNMLKEAGVDEVDLKMEGPTQIHNLLSLLKTEQNIYNIVFHELIRQVSVDCAERGQLLGKIRQRYVMLLNKIPQQVMSLYEDLLAQRALDRSLTEEIIIFKNSIGELTSELSQVREHDLRVSKDAKQAQAELARALEDAKKNANLSEEYRELYELQRNRLEKHMVHLTEERDLWSSATYRLARKVIEENQLTLCRRLYINEKIWTKVVRHFIVLLASNGTADLSKIQETTETWRWHMARFDKEVQRNEESSKEKLRIIRGDLEKWLCHFQQKVFVDWGYHDVHEDVNTTILQDMKSWEKMVNEELQQFEGSLLLNSQESLKTAAKLQKNWFQMTHKLLQRHRSMDGKEAPEQKAMEEVNNKVFVLCEHYRRRVEGENGFAKVLMSISGGLENWSLQLSTLKLAPYGIRESEWMNTYQLIPEWITLTDKALELIGSTSTENESTTNQDENVLLEDVFKILQQWVMATTSGTEKDNVHLTSEATALHTAMVQFMVNTLMLLTPDYPGHSESVTDSEEEELTLQRINEDALILSEKVNRFSSYIISCCQEMTENISMEKNSPINEDDPDYNPRGIDSLKNSCNEWIETCRLLIANLTANSASTVMSNNQNGTSDPEGQWISRKQTNMAAEQDVVMIIGHDRNIHKKLLKGEEIAISPESVLTVSRPGTPRSTDAFDSLISLDQMQKRLLSAELRAQDAEERSESLDEQLQEALHRIREFEKMLRRDESVEKQEDIASPVETTEQKITVTQVKKRPKSGKVKQQK